eukprot:gnl/MRDRNA2_/MRDRNA2_120115_c0_seq1.p1 gnl/MRDRNA2_/MRDRNA2_120115_c0~~gnl/MRDRNA2_/MRDRNA2_120115_c0_seq1.p1  ORF type:complete len:576 (-),score=107.50 gnl/MRDRNA2_/MRDRNA2_120115_c0_seq1:162-1889(-)
MLDAVRHFMPIEFLERYLRAMALYKANVFHWHLTDDQAWRLEIRSRPKLHQAAKDFSADFYSQADVKRIVGLAQELFITVVPVIETPGHAMAALSAYPELTCDGKHVKPPATRVGTYEDILCVTKKATVEFAEDVFKEVAELFPGPYVHAGGDEIPTTKWEASKDVRNFASQQGFRNHGPDVLEWWFCKVSEILETHGKKLVIWDDHIEHRDSQVSQKCIGAEDKWIIQAWKLEAPVGTDDKESVSINFPFRTVASPMRSCYLDYPVASIDYAKALSFEPMRCGANHCGRTLGGTANMWTEDSEPKDVGAKVYPRYLGLVERLWGGSRRKPESLNKPGHLAESSQKAAQKHCSKSGPLQSLFGFDCGRFELRAGGRSDFFKKARVDTTMQPFGEQYGSDRALDDDQDTYFWAISPNTGDTFDIKFKDPPAPSGAQPGRWIKSIKVQTGGKERPGDRLEKGELMAELWHPVGNSWGLRWVTVAYFNEGEAYSNGGALLDGPVIGIRVRVQVGQTKWCAFREFIVEERPPAPHPTPEDLPDPYHQGAPVHKPVKKKQVSKKHHDKGKGKHFMPQGYR